MAQSNTGSQTKTSKKVEPLLDLKFLSHGTVETGDLAKARRFYEEVLGLEIVQTSSVSLQLRLNSDTTVVCVETNKPVQAGMFSHIGFDVETQAEVDHAYEVVCKHKDAYGIQRVTKPVDQHGTYAFYIKDFDGNYWEILTNPPGGYSHLFERDERDDSWRERRLKDGTTISQ